MVIGDKFNSVAAIVTVDILYDAISRFERVVHDQVSRYRPLFQWCYVNFFTNHFLSDIRFILIPLVFILYSKTRVYFTVVEGKRRWMPLSLSFLLIAFFIWIAENISTFYGAWQYPDQVHVWTVVSTNKITSWFLLVIISFILVAYLKHYKKDVQKR